MNVTTKKLMMLHNDTMINSDISSPKHSKFVLLFAENYLNVLPHSLHYICFRVIQLRSPFHSLTLFPLLSFAVHWRHWGGLRASEAAGMHIIYIIVQSPPVHSQTLDKLWLYQSVYAYELMEFGALWSFIPSSVYVWIKRI